MKATKTPAWERFDEEMALAWKGYLGEGVLALKRLKGAVALAWEHLEEALAQQLCEEEGWDSLRGRQEAEDMKF